MRQPQPAASSAGVVPPSLLPGSMAPSALGPPSPPGLVEWMQVPAWQLSAVPGSMSSQSIWSPEQLPLAWQVSEVVHTLPSSQLVEGGRESWVQPVAVLQASTVHEFMSSQLAGAPGVQAPAVQTSPLVHALPSLQAPPSLVGVLTQTPLSALHESAVHGLPSSQLRRVPAVQVVPTQLSRSVHRSLSALHWVPAGSGVFVEQPLAPHMLVVH